MSYHLRDYYETGQNSSEGLYSIDGSTMMGVWQSFTPTESYTLKQVGLKLYRIGLPANGNYLSVDFYTVDGSGLPDLTNFLGTVQIAPEVIDGLTTNTQGEWITELVFDPVDGIELTAETQYALMVVFNTTPTTEDATCNIIQNTTTGSYLGGEAGTYDGSNLNKYGGDVDCYFRLYSDDTGPTNPTPAHEATAVDFSSFTLSWEYEGTFPTFQVYIGDYETQVLVAETEDLSYVTNLSEVPYNQFIYWRVDVTDGLEVITGDTWYFDARPAKVTTPSPANSATGIRLFPTYGWAASTVATSYNLHIEI